MTSHNLYERLLLEQIDKNSQNLMMLPSIFWTKHHSAFQHKFFDKEYDAMNHRYYGSPQCKENILKVPLIELKDKANFSRAEKWELLKASALSILQFDLAECTPEMINYALEKRPELLSLLDKSIQTEERIRKALAKEGLVLGFVQEEFKTYKNCKAAVAQNIWAIKYVPIDLMDDHFIKAVTESSEWVLNDLPYTFASIKEVEDHFFSLSKLKAFDSYVEIAALMNDQVKVYDYLSAVVEHKYKGFVFQNMSASFYLCTGFNVALRQFMADHGPEILYFFDLEQVHEIHIQNAILQGEIFEELPSSVWRSIFPTLIENKTEQFFFLPEYLKSLLQGSSAEVLEYCVKAAQEKPTLIVPNFMFDEVAYKGEVDEKIIQYAGIRRISDILVNGKIDEISELETIDKSNTTLFEISLLADKINITKLGHLFKHNAIWYPLLAIKTVENSIRFAQEFPTEHAYVDDSIKKDSEFINAVKETNPEFFDY